MKKCIILIILSLFSFVSCKKDKFPSTPTIVNGKVVDENDIPIEGYEFQFSGFNSTGLLKGNPTYNEYKQTNKEGVFYFSWVVSSDTDEVSLKPVGLKFTNGNYNTLYSDIYQIKDGKNIDAGAAGPIKYGKTNTFNFQVIIRKPDTAHN